MKSELKFTVILRCVGCCGVIGVNTKEIWESNLESIRCGSIDMQKTITGMY